MRALIGRQRQVLAVRQAGDLNVDVISSVIRDARDQHARDIFFGLRRPVLDAVLGDQRHRVAVAAHDAGLRRHVIGDDPVAAFLRELGFGIADDILGFGGKADDELRPVALAMRDASRGCPDFPSATIPACVAPGSFLIFSLPALATRQSATAAAKIATSAGKCVLDRRQHVARAFDVDDSNAVRIGHI